MTYENKLQIRYRPVYWSEGVAGFIRHEDKLKVRSQSVSWSEGEAGLIPNQDRLKVRSHYITINIVVRRGGGFDPY